MTVHQTLASRADELLQALGDTPDRVAAALAAGGHHGIVGLSHQCPVADYLRRSDLAVTDVAVGCAEIALFFDEQRENAEYVDVPVPVIAFVARFDNGEYEHLDARKHAAQAAAMTALADKVVARFAQELAEADTLQLEHLAQRAEARYTSDLGKRMRDLVDFERSRRVFTAAVGGAR
jgi:hypothetical protein